MKFGAASEARRGYRLIFSRGVWASSRREERTAGFSISAVFGPEVCSRFPSPAGFGRQQAQKGDPTPRDGRLGGWGTLDCHALPGCEVR